MILTHFALAAAFSAATCLAQSCGTGCSLHSLVFSDEFDGSAVNEQVWNYRTDQKGESAQLKSNVGVSDGSMAIALKKETVGSYTQ